MKNKLYFHLPSLLFLLLLLIPDPRVTILPRTDDGMAYTLEPYVDYLDTTKGSMGTFSTLSDSLIVFEYTLQKVNDNENVKPISGFTMAFTGSKTRRYLDAGGYDFLDIDISLKEANSFIIYIKTFEHFTDTTNWVTQRYSEAEVMLEPRKRLYRLPIKSLKTPNWWKSLIGPRFLTLPEEPDFTKIIAIDFQNNPGGALDIPERMEIRKIEFRKDRRPLYIFAFGGFLLWVAGVALFFFILKWRQLKRDSGSGKHIKHVDLSRHSDEQIERLETFIGSHFQQPELSVEHLSRECGISLPRISSLLKQKYQMNFKQYLNDVRITESKRLLKETDRTITEIAYAVGYNSIPHFNRVFRQLSDSTPTEFRDGKSPE
jgi:AraC-like DNA-binding protein